MADLVSLVALLTPRGRGAVATIAFRGDVNRIDAAVLFRAANGRALCEQPIDRAAFGRWGGDPAEEVVVCRVAEDRIEIHCHGGDAAAGRILTQFESLGATRLDWREFVERTEGLFAADVAEALAGATTPRTAAIIARQGEGPLREVLQRVSQADVVADRREILDRLHGLRRWAEFGLHLTRPWRVVLYGAPNVGKSSLINALVGFERAIVFDRPGTTRDVVTAETALDGWPVRLSDTAGLRVDAEELEAAGIERAKTELAEADLRVLVLDRSEPPEPESFRPLAGLKPRLVVLNKIDLPDAMHEDPLPSFMVAVSAKTGEGVRELMTRIVAQLVPEAPTDDTAVPVTPRQIEMVRIARKALVGNDVDGFRRAMDGIWP